MSSPRFGDIMEEYECDKCHEPVAAFSKMCVHADGTAHCIPCAIGADDDLKDLWERMTPPAERAKYMRGVEHA